MLLFFAGMCGEKSYEVSKFEGGVMKFWIKYYNIFDFFFQHNNNIILFV